MRSVILVVGNTGTGKTETIKQIASKLHLPYTIEDATQYTKEGYVGSSVNDMIDNLIEAANEDIELAQHGIIIIDEIDKKAGKDNEDVGGNAVLKSLLKLMEGSKIPVYPLDEEDDDCSFEPKKVMFDTSNVTFIFLGAFEGMDEIINKKIGKSNIGFSSKISVKDSESNNITDEDLNKYGFPEEFIGRISSIVQMNPICTVEDYASILRHSKISIIQKYRKELKKIGINLRVSPKAYLEIAQEACKKKTGARALKTVVDGIFENILLEIFSSPPATYSKCSISSVKQYKLT